MTTSFTRWNESTYIVGKKTHLVCTDNIIESMENCEPNWPVRNAFYIFLLVLTPLPYWKNNLSKSQHAPRTALETEIGTYSIIYNIKVLSGILSLSGRYLAKRNINALSLSVRTQIDNLASKIFTVVWSHCQFDKLCNIERHLSIYKEINIVGHFKLRLKIINLLRAGRNRVWSNFLASSNTSIVIGIIINSFEVRREQTNVHTNQKHKPL